VGRESKMGEIASELTRVVELNLDRYIASAAYDRTWKLWCDETRDNENENTNHAPMDL
jgi:hypothetical protein